MFLIVDLAFIKKGCQHVQKILNKLNKYPAALSLWKINRLASYNFFIIIMLWYMKHIYMFDSCYDCDSCFRSISPITSSGPLIRPSPLGKRRCKTCWFRDLCQLILEKSFVKFLNNASFKLEFIITNADLQRSDLPLSLGECLPPHRIPSRSGRIWFFLI